MAPEGSGGEAERGRAAYRRAVIEETGRAAAEAAFQLGALERDAGRTAEARAAFELAIAGGDAEVGAKAWGSLAVLEAVAGRVDEARAAFQEAIDSGHPEYGRKALVDLGNLELEQGRVAEAEELFRRAAEDDDPETAERGRDGLSRVEHVRSSYFQSPPPVTGHDLEFLRRYLPVAPERIDRAEWASGRRPGHGYGDVEIWAGDEEYLLYLDPRDPVDFRIYMFLKDRLGFDTEPSQPAVPPAVAFETACRRGENIDALLWEGRLEEAELQHRQALADLHASGRADAFLVAKHALGLMYALVFQKRHVDAHAIWIARNPPESELWVRCLEDGRLGGRDSACYTLVEAHLAALATDRRHALEGMKSRSSLAAGWAVEQGDAEVCSSALSNWRLHLYEIYEGGVPPSEMHELQEFARTTGLSGDFWSDRLWFPRLAPWRPDREPPEAAVPLPPPETPD